VIFGRFCRIIAFPDKGRLIGALRQVTVNAVVADVQLATGKPLRGAGVDIAVLDGLPGRDPVEQRLGLFGPERIGVFDGLPIEALVALLTELRAPAHCIGMGKLADIEH
jgi:hypothetical protein